MADLEKGIPAPDEESKPGVLHSTGLDPTLNPFSEAPPIVERPTKPPTLGGNSILGSGLEAPVGQQIEDPSHEASGATKAIAKKVAGIIASMHINGDHPDEITFPKCADTSVINEALEEIKNTPLGLGFGPFPKTVELAWARFVQLTTDYYREANNLETVELVPITINLPEWIKDNPSFDIFSDCALIDIEVNGEANSTMFSELSNCRVLFHDTPSRDAIIGRRAKRSTFIFEKNYQSQGSFAGASNLSIHIKGTFLSGSIGSRSEGISQSKLQCDSNTKAGGYYYCRGEQTDHRIHAQGLQILEGY